MGDKGADNSSLWESLSARLGYFLIASSFLIAAFITLVTAGKGIYIADREINILVHAIAALGSFIAALYGFMNFWPAMPDWLAKRIRGAKPTSEQVLHTYLVPFSFLVFWLVVWIAVTDFWLAIPLVLAFLIICLVYQIFRK